MQYIFLIYGDEKQWSRMPPGEMDDMYGAFRKYSEALTAAGVMRGGSELKPVATATTVRSRNGKVTTVDGPFAETKEQLGGYYIVDVPHLEKALEWAGKCPGARLGAIEVRPLVER
ncbi:MAG TPA: YciI family protein [Myxococcaceae bacterium]|nr:YciI family protein [Myxococcaceae bacterium]